jgi:hypothetical protein
MQPGGRRLPRPATLPTDALAVWNLIVELVPEARRDPEPLDAFTPGVRQLYAMSRLNAEVLNGGFSQFLFNGGGVYFDEAIAGLGRAGLEQHRELTIEAADHGVTQFDSLRAAWQQSSIEAYSAWAQSSGFGPFDDRWYSLDPVDEALDRFVADHADEIWEPPS